MTHLSDPVITIAVQSYKSPDMLRLCLASIFASRTTQSYEVLVSDGDTQEDTEMLMREDFPSVRFFPFTENVGFGALVNKSIDESRGQYILLLNADAVLSEDAIEKMYARMEANKKIGILGPLQRNFNGAIQETCFRFYKPWTIVYRRTFLKHFSFARKHLAWFTMKDYDHKEPRSVDWIMGSAMMVRRRAIERVGQMDPRFFMYMEDVDWCRRFWENGFSVLYDPNVEIFHYLGKGSGTAQLLHALLFNRLTWIHISSGIKYFIKYAGTPTPVRASQERVYN